MDSTSYIIHIVDIILRQWAVDFEKDDIRNILCSDPSFPSIKALHDTLAYYGLKSNVYEAKYEHILNKPYCVIHTHQDNGHFYYVKEIDKEKVCLYDGINHILTKEKFLDLWDGVVLLLEGKVFTYKRVRSFKLSSLFILLLVSSLVSCIPILICSIGAFVQLSLDTIGLALSCLIYGQALFMYRDIPFCHIGEHFDCSVVSKANPLRQLLPIGLPEIGIAFFIFDWLSLLIGGHQSSCSLIYPYLLAAVCMVTLIVYQLIVIRKYCLYCLAISLVVFLKLFLVQAENSFVISISQILTATVIAVSITAIIILYGQALKVKNEMSLKLLTIKRTPHIFDMLIHRKSQVNIIRDHALLFGNENAKIAIDTIISLNCSHCKRMVKDMCVLLNEMPDAVCWRVYIEGIDVDTDNPTTNNKQLHLVNQYLNDRSLAFCSLNEWRFCNSKCTISPTAQLRYANILADIRQMGFKHYPTILFNNYPFPSEYEISDMKVLIHDWLQKGTTL